MLQRLTNANAAIVSEIVDAVLALNDVGSDNRAEARSALIELLPDADAVIAAANIRDCPFTVSCLSPGDVPSYLRKERQFLSVERQFHSTEQNAPNACGLCIGAVMCLCRVGGDGLASESTQGDGCPA
jgi:hypothetical protein